VRYAFRKVLKAAHLPHFTPHSLRHTYASLLLIAGVDVYYVSRMLGHANISETVDTYGRWLPANRKGALDVLDSKTRATEAVTNL
jgi:integrase